MLLQLYMEQLCYHLKESFGDDNVINMSDRKTIKVRPMWVRNGGKGYCPTLLDMIDVMDGFFIAHKFSYEMIVNHFISEYPYYKISTDDGSIIVSIHHMEDIDWKTICFL